MHFILINSTRYETQAHNDARFSVSFTAITGVRIPLGTPPQFLTAKSTTYSPTVRSLYSSHVYFLYTEQWPRS
jgi:hypothetical protein